MYPRTTFLGKKFGLHHQKPVEDIAHKLLELRNIDDESGFFSSSLDTLHDPFLLPDMQVAVDRIMLAKKQNERVMIFGDYDADGVSSTAALFLFLRDDMGMQVSYRIPHRIEDGYGLKEYFIDEIATTGTTLIITVDCGIRDADVVSYARSKNIDVIVTDHHTPGERLPDDAVAVVNPHRKDSTYPYRDLSGSGVVLKLIQAIDPTYVAKYVDICAIGTIADVMPLTGENRTIASQGLDAMGRSVHACFGHLVPRGVPLDADFVGYQIGPLINAAGRMDTPISALQMLIAGPREVVAMIDRLKRLNEQRKADTIVWYDQARKAIDSSLPVLTYHAQIPHGIIGLVAGKICGQYHKPTIIMADEGEYLVGSCRSPQYLHITDMLDQHADMFENYGGHAQAAGFTIKKDLWPNLQKKLIASIKEATKDISIEDELIVDFPLVASQIDLSLLDEIHRMSPFGVGNPKPLFVFSDLQIQDIRKLGSENRHLKLITPQAEIVAWGWGEHYESLVRKGGFRVIGELGANEWNGKRSLQIRLVDVI